LIHKNILLKCASPLFGIGIVNSTDQDFCHVMHTTLLDGGICDPTMSYPVP